jgi:hypothetical protein
MCRRGVRGREHATAPSSTANDFRNRKTRRSESRDNAQFTADKTRPPQLRLLNLSVALSFEDGAPDDPSDAYPLSPLVVAGGYFTSD